MKLTFISSSFTFHSLLHFIWILSNPSENFPVDADHTPDAGDTIPTQRSFLPVVFDPFPWCLATLLSYIHAGVRTPAQVVSAAPQHFGGYLQRSHGFILEGGYAGGVLGTLRLQAIIPRYLQKYTRDLVLCLYLWGIGVWLHHICMYAAKLSGQSVATWFVSISCFNL